MQGSQHMPSAWMDRLKQTSGKAGAIGVAAGVVAGGAAGLWLRLMMRLIALTVSPGPAVIQNVEGELVRSKLPVFTPDGSLSVVFFPAAGGFFLGILFFLARVAVPSLGKWRGTVFGVALLLFPGVPLLLDTPELSIGPQGLGIALFALTPFVFGWVFEGALRLSDRRPAP